MCAGNLTVLIAGLPIRLACEDSGLLELLARKYADFLDYSSAGFIVQVDWLTDGPSGDNGHPLVAFNNDRIAVFGPGYQGDIKIKDEQAGLKISTTQPEQGVDYFLRLICAFDIFRAGGILLHSAGIVRDHCAHIFLGKSGSGKTTVSRLTVDGVVLNDDLIALMPGDDGWIAYATPFTNATQVKPNAVKAPVSGVYRLVQDRMVYLEKASKAEAVAELVASVPIVASNPCYASALVERCESLAEIYPVFNLHFRKDADFWKLIENRDQF